MFGSPIIVSKMCLATVVPNKSVEQFAVKKIIAFLAEVGFLRGGMIPRPD